MKPIIALVLAALPSLAFSSPSAEYEISFPNAAHHEARVSVTYTGLGTDPVEFRMSRSSPGRYAVHNFAKNVYQVSIVNGAGEPLSYTRPSPEQWNVAGHDGTITTSYTLYGDQLDGTYTAIDRTHAHLNMPATFMWARGLEHAPITIRFRPDEKNWRVATQLAPTDDPLLFTAPDLQYFMDSPTELSNFSERSWTVEAAGKSQTIRLAVHHGGIEEDVDVLADKIARVIDEQIQIFGELPAFDFGTYTFIADYLPYADGDGMEHRNSTILTGSDELIETDFRPQLETIGHEFVHAWNVERIRPSDLEPFDFERSNMTPNLWFAEGFTEYLGLLSVRRAGESTIEEFFEYIAGYIHSVMYSPGRSFGSPLSMSKRAPFVDDATSIDPTNFANVHISYYSYGCVLAAALDLTLREKFDGVTLDDLMRYMWQEHGKSERTYTTADIRTALATVTGDIDFAEQFFNSYITGSELPDYGALLVNAGLMMKKENEGAASAGPVKLIFEGKAALIADNTLVGSPLYEAGLDRGDQIIAIDRLKIQSQENWDAALERFKPGDTATVTYLQREIMRASELTFTEDNAMIIVKYEDEDMKISRTQQRFRDSWIGPDSETER